MKSLLNRAAFSSPSRAYYYTTTTTTTTPTSFSLVTIPLVLTLLQSLTSTINAPLPLLPPHQVMAIV